MKKRNKKYRSYQFFYKTGVIFLFLFLIASCKKYKKPAEVKFYTDIEHTSTLSHITFNEGYVVLKDFEFDGDRQKGDDVYFKSDYPDGQLVSFDETLEIEALDFQIPQGIYKRLNLRMRTSDDISNTSMFIKGFYTNTSGIDIPLQIELEDEQSFDVRAEDDEDEIIVLDETITSKAMIRFDPYYWVSPISINAFENASLVNVDGTNTLLINKNNNEDIYDIILDRVDDAIEVKFSY